VALEERVGVRCPLASGGGVDGDDGSISTAMSSGSSGWRLAELTRGLSPASKRPVPVAI
jgi:hypothetical protein